MTQNAFEFETSLERGNGDVGRRVAGCVDGKSLEMRPVGGLLALPEVQAVASRLGVVEARLAGGDVLALVLARQVAQRAIKIDVLLLAAQLSVQVAAARALQQLNDVLLRALSL